MHGHTYQAHPVACAAALEVQRIIREDNLLDNVQRHGRAAGDRADGALRQPPPCRRHPRPRPVLGPGVRAPTAARKQVFDPALKLNERVKQEALARGLAIYPMGGTIDGKRGDHVIVAPPYIVTAAEIDTIVDRLGEAVDAAIVG